jgi:hypothetical protein
MYCLMAFHAERDQVLNRVLSDVTSSANMMNVEIGQTSALLAPPPIALKDLSPKFAIRPPT